MNDHTSLPPVQHVLAIDLGTGYCSQACLKDGKPFVLKDASGTTIPTVVFRKGDGETVVGEMAQRMAYKDPANYFSNFKTAIKDDGVASLSADGSFTVVDAFAAVFKHLRNLAIQAMPYLSGFEQFGGSKHPASELRIAITIPAVDFGLAQIAKYREALVQSGFPKRHIDDVVFFKEPHAAAHSALAERGIRSSLMNGDVIVVVDIGDGTTDISVVEFREGLLHTKVAHSGLSDVGGSNLTAAICDVIGKELRIPYRGFVRGDGNSFDRKGIKAADRENQYGILRASEDAKHQLSVSDSAYATVSTSKGNREAEVSIAEARLAWRPLFREMGLAIGSALGASGLTWGDVKYVVAAGGGSRNRDIRELIAESTERPMEDVLVCDEPQHAIVEGAVRMAQNVADVDTTVVDGFGLSYLSADGRGKVNETYIANGQIIPAGGLDVEKLTTKVTSSGRPEKLTLLPFITKPGVVANDGDLLKDSEIVRLKPVEVDLNLPAGDHPVATRIRNDIAQRAMAVLSFPTLGGIDSVVTTLQVAESDDEVLGAGPAKLVVLFDASYSMEGKPIEDARTAVCEFLNAHLNRGVEVAVIRFGGTAKTVVGFTSDSAKALNAVRKIQASSDTPMAGSLVHAKEILDAKEKGQNIVVLFSDGYANRGTEEETIKAAVDLRSVAEIYTVPIGERADCRLLKKLASSFSHYIPVGRASDLKVAFDRINTLIYTGAQNVSPTPSSSADAALESWESDFLKDLESVV